MAMGTGTAGYSLHDVSIDWSNQLAESYRRHGWSAQLGGIDYLPGYGIDGISYRFLGDCLHCHGPRGGDAWLFGFAEFLLVKDHLSASAGALFRRPWVLEPQQLEFHLQGSADWNRLWRELVLSAEEQNLGALCLDINAPAIQETYHASWTR